MPVGAGKALSIPLAMRFGPIHVSRHARAVPWRTGSPSGLGLRLEAHEPQQCHHDEHDDYRVGRRQQPSAEGLRRILVDAVNRPTRWAVKRIRSDRTAAGSADTERHRGAPVGMGRVNILPMPVAWQTKKSSANCMVQYKKPRHPRGLAGLRQSI